MVRGEEISDDGLVTLHEEECLGVCDFAPGGADQLRATTTG